MILGLTGGLGCGKSTAAGMFAARGYRTIDSDAIVRDVVLKERAVVAAIGERFGNGVLTAAGAVDRRQVARRIFEDPAARRWLEELVHPRVFSLWRTSLDTAPAGNWILEVPLLFEKSLQNWFDLTIGVASDAAVQLARLEQRGLPPPLARQRISQQLPLAQKIELADFVFLNDGSLDFLREQVDRVVDLLSLR